jgi:hypothetical protein
MMAMAALLIRCLRVAGSSRRRGERGADGRRVVVRVVGAARDDKTAVARHGLLRGGADREYARCRGRGANHTIRPSGFRSGAKSVRVFGAAERDYSGLGFARRAFPEVGIVEVPPVLLVPEPSGVGDLGAFLAKAQDWGPDAQFLMSVVNGHGDLSGSCVRVLPPTDPVVVPALL